LAFENRDILKPIAIIAWLSLLIWKTDCAIAAFVAGTLFGSMLLFVEPRYVGILAIGIYVPSIHAPLPGNCTKRLSSGGINYSGLHSHRRRGGIDLRRKASQLERFH